MRTCDTHYQTEYKHLYHAIKKFWLVKIVAILQVGIWQIMHIFVNAYFPKCLL